ncbi:hypothetical protein BJY00DRAFT_271068 [Aspergillus carlsbadensis]|nr:hypothetical protein BJY00DRAFT_271068 [Aspergillus carlsbadensis]
MLNLSSIGSPAADLNARGRLTPRRGSTGDAYHLLYHPLMTITTGQHESCLATGVDYPMKEYWSKKHVLRLVFERRMH